MLLNRANVLGEEAAGVLNKLLIFFFIPIITILHVPNLKLEASLLWLNIAPFIVFATAIIFFHLSSLVLSIDVETRAALILSCGISSTSFVGFPIFDMLYGEEGLVYGIMMSIGGTILVFNTAGLATLQIYTDTQKHWTASLLDGLRFFPFIVFCVALFLNFINFSFSHNTNFVLTQLASPFAVIALLTIGLQLDINEIHKLKKEITLGLLFKLILAPLLIYLLLWEALNIRNLVSKICIMGAAIGSMNAMSIMAANRGLRPQLSISMPTISIPLSIPSLFIINYWLS